MDLTTFIDAYRGPLVGLIASWGAGWGEAVEIAEESFAEAWLRRESCSGDWEQPEVFGRWLRGVALNQYRNWARSRRRRQARVVNVEPARIAECSAAVEESPSEHLEALRAAIERLPTKLRQVVLMHYLEETSVSEVAALLLVSAKTVEGRLYQARRALRRMLEDKRSQGDKRSLNDKRSLDDKHSRVQIARMLLCL